MATLLQRRRLGLVRPGRDVDLGKEGAAASWGWGPHAAGALLPRPPTLTCRTTPTTGRFRVRPGTGAGHWSISLHTVDRGGQHQWPVPSKGCRPKPPGAVARRDLWPGPMAAHLLPGREPACRSTRGRSGSAVPGTAGQRAGGTPAPETAGPTGPVRCHPLSHSGACRDP